MNIATWKKISKSKTSSDYLLAKQLSLNSRYLDDIAVINLLGFRKIAQDIYHPSLQLEGSTSGYHYDTFLDLNIRIFQGKFVIGVYHKVDYFNFTVISYPFLCSNIYSQIGYNTFYSQLVRFFRLCNNIKDFVVRVSLIRYKLRSRGYDVHLLYRYFNKFCYRYPVCLKYNVANGRALWDLSYDISESGCIIYDEVAIKGITRPFKIVLEDMHFNLKSNTFLDLKDCYIPLTDIMKEIPTANVNTQNDLDIVPSTAHVVVPFGLSNSSNHCYLNSCLQNIFHILRTNGNNIHTNSNPEGHLINQLLTSLENYSEESIAEFKSNLSSFSAFFDGHVQRDAFECFDKILDLLHKGTKVNLIELDDSDVEDDLVTSLTYNLFWYTFKKSFTCNSCGNCSYNFLR